MALEIATTDSQEYKFNPLNFGTLHFSVQASNDAHVALTSTNANKPPKYEIFIGGWGNSKSSIRKNNEEPDKVIVDTPKVLNGNEARGFWIKWGGGYIGIGKQGEAKAFMSWQDDETINVAYFGVRTGWGASGIWTIEVILHGSLSFSVLCDNDAHIALTTNSKESEPMIEVILGGWKNTASAVRYNKQLPDKVHVDTPQLLSKSTPSKFVIFWKDGVIEVFKDYIKLFEWIDPKPFNISHYGVRTCWGAVGTWCVNGTADEQFRSKAVTSKPLNPQAPPAASPGWNIGGSTTGPVQWVRASNGQIPPNALPGGFDANKEQLYIARAEHSGALIPGKLVPSHGVTYVAWGGVENPKENYEVLCNCNGTWVKANNGEIPVGALSSGHTEEGEPLFVGRGEHDGTMTVGKTKLDNLRGQNEKGLNELILDLLKIYIEKPSDDHDVFGAYVAMELRNLKTSDAQKKLRTLMRDAISHVVKEEIELPIKNSNSEDVNNIDQHNNSQTSHKTTVSNDFCLIDSVQASSNGTLSKCSSYGDIQVLEPYEKF